MGQLAVPHNKSPPIFLLLRLTITISSLSPNTSNPLNRVVSSTQVNKATNLQAVILRLKQKHQNLPRANPLQPIPRNHQRAIN